MKTYAVSFKISEDLWSTNMIWANTGDNEYAAVCDTAGRRARKFGYTAFIISDELSEAAIKENFAKGMPLYSIDSIAEQTYDPSFRDPG